MQHLKVGNALFKLCKLKPILGFFSILFFGLMGIKNLQLLVGCNHVKQIIILFPDQVVNVTVGIIQKL